MNRLFPEPNNLRVPVLVLVLSVVTAGSVHAESEVNWDVLPNQVYSVVDGAGLVMDIFKPKPETNGLGMIVVNSGAWYCGRAVYESYKKKDLFRNLCDRGYTVFFVSPGSRPRFSGEEMVDNLKTSVRWIKLHAEEFGIDPDRLGIIGASSGGHLSLMAAVSAKDASPEAANPIDRPTSRVAALAVFCPPTDLVSWNGGPEDYRKLEDLFVGCSQGVSDEELLERAKRISPLLQIKEPIAPLLLVHGDADDLVPLAQSEKMVEAIQEVGGEVELIVKPGGGHSWPGISEEFLKTVDWFDHRFRPGTQ